ncbi:hypothetical protein RDn1_183 [Candidatus Termititenax dinenymphae]|uniref:Uncharacterized protein n=1 Tax=Candidatus Termititenax dinenymphae TaxID=2218523 RepID=A0A388TLF8_9BACT|nr:hypothetical protein RDn1_183 [Candidatus Termititenax dinenymphae]
MFKRLNNIFVIVMLSALLGAVEYAGNDWSYYNFWNLYNSGVSNPNSVMLNKNPEHKERWTATMRLRNYHFVNEYIGKKMYFITEYTGDDVVRLNPSFYVIKEQKEYQVWWPYPGTQDRQYVSFWGHNGLILDSLDIPSPRSTAYYAQLGDGRPFVVTDTSPLTIYDILNGLRTDWQHDIPGAYALSAQDQFPGIDGTAVFQRFYVGALPPEAVLVPEQNERLSKLTAAEKEILVNECGLPALVFRNTQIPANFYVYPNSLLNNALAFYERNKKAFANDLYFQKKNYLPKGANGFDLKIIANDPKGTTALDSAQRLVIRGKTDPYAWTIISLGSIESSQKLAELKGPARLTVWFDALGLRTGYYGWQNIFLDVVQYDKSGKIIGSNDDLIFPVLSREPKITNYAGILEHEFVVARDAVRIELLLKIAGAPDTEKDKPGALVDQLTLERVALQKGTGVLDVDKLFKAGVPLTENGGKVTYKPSGAGLFVGDRSVVIGSADRSIKYNLKTAGDYSGFYTNIFDVSKIDELEVAAAMSSQLQRHGNPPDWAGNAIEMTYFNENGEQVYASDAGDERYPRISAAPNLTQTRKSLFVVPKQRGARYAQIKMHFLRDNDPQNNRPSAQDYFLGQAAANFITLRPSLQLSNPLNFLPNGGSFYDNINGQPLSWTVQGASVEEDLQHGTRKVVFDNWNVSGWSAIKTEVDIPPEANALHGKMYLNMDQIETGLNQWEGFGFFLEADVQTPSGALFHYSGVPVYEHKKDGNGDRYVLLGRMSAPRHGEVDYFIPLTYENQKIVKLYWQVALLGKGRVELETMDPVSQQVAYASFYHEKAFNPLLWSQYSLYAADGNSFQFQKAYELKTVSGVYNYDYAETLAERLQTTGLETKNIAAELKELSLNDIKKTAKYEIKTLPAYGRVSTLADFDGQVIEVSFKTSGTKDARFNLQAFIVNEQNGNVHQAPIYRLENDGTWKTIDRVFEVGQAERFVIDSSEYPGLAKKVLLTLGGYQGIVNFSGLVLTQYEKFDRKTLTGKKAEIKMAALGDASFASILKRPETMDMLSTANLVDLQEAYPQGFLSVAAQKLDDQIRASVKDKKLSFDKGAWAYQKGQSFSLSGFTLLGETFQEWQRLHGKDLQAFCREQSKIWKKAGLNTVRVHQLFTSWANLSEADLDQLIIALKNWQAEGFVIIVDALPNTDFTGSYFKTTFAGKPYAEGFSNTNDLFKAALVLPEVSEQYVKPALQKLAQSFQKNNFWPDSLTYANETGFTRGFWTVDKNNDQADQYFSRAYHYYYGRYLQQTGNDKVWQDFVAKSDELVQNHVQSVKLKQLLADVTALNNAIAEKYYVKDTGGYLYYNILRDDVLNAFPAYQKELTALREDGYSWITNAEPTGNYIERSTQIAKENKTRINKLLLSVDYQQTTSAKALQTLLTTAALQRKIQEVHNAVFAEKMPESYKIPNNLTLAYIDDFTNYDHSQVFFTSFLLPVVFTQDVDSFLRTQTKQNFVIGLNNDYARDVGMLVGNAYIFFNEPQTELRFNKYAHHPIGGHSMLLNPGFGNLFDEDSNIDLNLELFTPPAVYPVQISETNYTFAGDDKAGEGTWTVMDYLRNVAKKNNILFFHYGPNAVDKPIINDYFNMGNRPYQLNTMALIGSAALQKRLDNQYILPGDFLYDRFQEKIDLQSKGVNGIAGRAIKNKELKGRSIGFTYKGERAQTNVTVIEQKLSGKETVIYLFGLERNKGQKQRPGNSDLIQSYGVNAIQYESLPGIIRIADRKVSKITGYYPSGKTVDIPLRYVRPDNGSLILELTAFPGIVCYHIANE